jgi:hypothetical protein
MTDNPQTARRMGTTATREAHNNTSPGRYVCPRLLLCWWNQTLFLCSNFEFNWPIFCLPARGFRCESHSSCGDQALNMCRRCVGMTAAVLLELLFLAGNEATEPDNLRSLSGHDINLPKVPHCGARDIAAGAGGCGKWLPQSEAPKHELRYGHNCPFISARYNCVQLDSENKSSANRYYFKSCEPAPAPHGCTIPTLHQALSKLAGKRVLLCGDSHARQLFEEILCLLHATSVLVSVNEIAGPWIPEAVEGCVHMEHFLCRLRCRLLTATRVCELRWLLSVCFACSVSQHLIQTKHLMGCPCGHSGVRSQR